jgi:hypothetical protein
LKRGYVCPETECLTIHENSLKECVALLKTVVSLNQWMRKNV